ncbi:hypothetical protein ABT369_38715 [Dactylosporangium sp. NPDC000244]|uniref:hypothetical protein n=1 Tax=Dactylosporangium sp. NPDC000244 TaxID=3154365 RepID=UPI0033261FA8
MAADLHTNILADLDARESTHVSIGPEVHAALRAVVEQAHVWSLLAPPDDWGDTPQHTERADIGRHLLRTIADQLGLDREGSTP